MRVFTLVLLTLMLSGCPKSAPADGPPVDADATGSDDVMVEADSAVVPPEPASIGRQVHRMTIAQLASSIPVITGGIAWIEDFGSGAMDMLQILYGTLGGPDYLLVTEENLDPSLILAKFVQDAAYRICIMWVTRDRGLPAGERTLIVHDDWDSQDPSDVDQSLVALQLRFFARKLDPGDPDDDAAVEALRTLFQSAAAAAPDGEETNDGWGAVCLALMTSPEMVLY